MICYRDMTFCPFWKECYRGKECGEALTPYVEAAAEKWWGKPNAPICRFADKPECFKEIE